MMILKRLARLIVLQGMMFGTPLCIADAVTGTVGSDSKEESVDKLMQDAGPGAAESVADFPMYRPPQRGAPAARVGGGTRGPGDASAYIALITPPHTAYTTQAQPTLFWYLSKAVTTRFEFALISDVEVQPMINSMLNESLLPGIHRLSLSDFGVTLEPGKSYQWSIALVQDPDQRSSDILSSGRIRYEKTSRELEERLQQSTPEQAVRIYAETGYWYDAIATLSELIGRNPEDPSLVRQRIALLQQADLPVVSAFEQAHLQATAQE
ncbi:MAG: DUF928 domain-containing protein [Gammaproteobacteria bacterium]